METTQVSTDRGRMSTMWPLHTTELSSAFEKKGGLAYTTKWANSENMMLSEQSRTERPHMRVHSLNDHKRQIHGHSAAWCCHGLCRGSHSCRARSLLGG